MKFITQFSLTMLDSYYCMNPTFKPYEIQNVDPEKAFISRLNKNIHWEKKSTSTPNVASVSRQLSNIYHMEYNDHIAFVE